MTDTLKSTIQSDMKDAMKGGNKTRLATIRLIMAAIKQREVDERIELNNDQIIAVLDKMVKQRRESIKMYQDAERLDLAEIELNEIAVIQDFLPESLSEAEIDQMIKSAVAETGAETMRDMGKVMGKLKPLIQGRADMAQVSSRIKNLLS